MNSIIEQKVAAFLEAELRGFAGAGGVEERRVLAQHLARRLREERWV